MAASPTALIQALELQAGICAQMGSPFSAMVARAVAADMDAGGVFAELAEPWTGAGVPALLGDAVPLRFMGGLHYLALTGDAPVLASVYPPTSAALGGERMASVLADAARAHRATLAAFVSSPPQTNEVNRSMCLIGGFLTVAQRTGLPLRCLEVGASAGLNLNWDLYRYDLGSIGAWGDPGSPVRLSADWDGPPPPFATSAHVIERRGCDRNPVDVTSPDEALRLKAYIWPDQVERLARLDAAIVVARRRPVRLERADAADWVRTNAHAKAGAATVLYHSVVWQYLSAPTQAAIREATAVAGESATATAPFAWLRMEPHPADLAAPLDLTLQIWPDGNEIRLARVHPHGSGVIWSGD